MNQREKYCLEKEQEAPYHSKNRWIKGDDDLIYVWLKISHKENVMDACAFWRNTVEVDFLEIEKKRLKFIEIRNGGIYDFGRSQLGILVYEEI